MIDSRFILETFYRANGGFVPRTALGRNAPAGIAELESLGYIIETHPHHGYRLLSTPDRLTADDIKARMNGSTVIGTEILVFEQTGSTNDVAAQLAAAGAREGLVVFAESQTKGRGRHRRVWASPRGKGLWFSVLLRPNLPVSATPRITIAASVAIARAVRETTSLEARIKWPNDITIAGKKVAGILTELHDGVAILGIGIDVNCAREDFPASLAGIATSLALESGHSLDRAALAAAVLAVLDDLYRRAQTDFDAVVSEWARWCTTLGRQIAVKMGPHRLDGIANALDSDGALLLRRDNGQIERILGADVIMERS